MANLFIYEAKKIFNGYVAIPKVYNGMELKGKPLVVKIGNKQMFLPKDFWNYCDEYRVIENSNGKKVCVGFIKWKGIEV